MINQAEREILLSPLLSHMARTLYVFYLRPLCLQENCRADLLKLTEDLRSESAVFPCTPTMDDVVQVLEELQKVGLIRKPHNVAWAQASLEFPYFAKEIKNLPQPPFSMTPNWQPGPGFKTIALHAGLKDYSFSAFELADFVGFWSDKNMQRSQSGWEHLFIKRLIKIHIAQSAPQNVKKQIEPITSYSFLPKSSLLSPEDYAFINSIEEEQEPRERIGAGFPIAHVPCQEKRPKREPINQRKPELYAQQQQLQQQRQQTHDDVINDAAGRPTGTFSSFTALLKQSQQ